MSEIIYWIANILIVIGLIFMGLGIYGTFRFNDFFKRILITAKIDAVGFITVLIGLIIRQGFTFFSLKVFLVFIMYLITNPLATHATLRSADHSGYKIKKER